MQNEECLLMLEYDMWEPKIKNFLEDFDLFLHFIFKKLLFLLFTKSLRQKRKEQRLVPRKKTENKFTSWWLSAELIKWT